MYTKAADVEEWLKHDRAKPFILCEYAHAMGNSLGAIHKYTELMEREPLFQGGFIWDFIDQTLVKKDRYGHEYYAYGGDFGERPTDYEFSGNGIVYGDRTPSPKMQEVKAVYQTIRVTVDEGSVTVKNRALFTNTDIYDCVVLLQKEGVLLAEAVLKTTVPPLSEAVYPLPIEIPYASGEYVITVSFRLSQGAGWAEHGHEVAFGQYVKKNHIAIPKDCHSGLDSESNFPNPLILPAPGTGAKIANQGFSTTTAPLSVVYGRLNLGVRGEHFEVLFSGIKGALVSYRWDGVEMINSIPTPNFWRAPTDNDHGNAMPARYGQWLLASRYAAPRRALDVKPADGGICVTFTYDLPTCPASQCSVTYTVLGDGTVAVKMAYEPVEGLADMPVFGFLMAVDADYDRVEWYGMGPEETYVDRCHGGKLDVYRGRVIDQMAKYLVPQETGNKVGVRWAKVTNAKGNGLVFHGNNMEFSALPYTPFELENATHPNELPPILRTVIRANLGQMGVGGDDSWGALTHPEYLLPGDKALTFEFEFKGI
jgi:beta-galactosidase